MPSIDFTWAEGHWSQLKSLVAKCGQKCWIWFRGNPLEDGGMRMSGWFGSVAPLGGVKCEHHEFVPRRLPQWRVAWDEPKDLKAAYGIPRGF